MPERRGERRDGDIAFQAVQPQVNLGQWAAQMFMVQLWDQPMFYGASWVGPTLTDTSAVRRGCWPAASFA